MYTPFVSGSGAFVAAMAQRLVRDGHNVTVLTTNAQQPADFWQPPEQRSPLPIYETIAGVAVQRLPLAYPRPAPYAFGVLRRLGPLLQRAGLPAALSHPIQRHLSHWMPPLQELAPTLDRLVTSANLVHVVDASWDGLLVGCAEATQVMRKPLVVQPLLHWGNRSIAAHFTMAHQIEVYRRADAVIALAPAEAKVIHSLGVREERIHVLRMGIDLPTARSTLLNGSTSAVGERPTVAFLGANTFDKGAQTLAEAIIKLNRADIAVDAVFAGPQDEDLRAFLARQPAAHRGIIAAHLRVLGVVDDATKHRLLATCTLFALPSQVETFGIVFLEAWLHGKPVIGADAGGIPALVEHGQTGLLVPFGDAPALAAAIGRLLRQPDLREALGAAGRANVLAHYTWNRTYETLLPIYEAVL